MEKFYQRENIQQRNAFFYVPPDCSIPHGTTAAFAVSKYPCITQTVKVKHPHHCVRYTVTTLNAPHNTSPRQGSTKTGTESLHPHGKSAVLD